MSKVSEFSRPSKRNSLSARLNDLIERSRTPSPASEMRRASLSTVKPLTSNPKLFYPQPTIDPSPPSPAGSSHRRSPPKTDNIMLPYEEEEAHRLQEQTTRALQEAMQTDCSYRHSRHGSGSRPSSLQRLGNARLPPPMLSRPMRTTPLLDLARQTTLVSTSAAHLPSDPASYYLENIPVKSSSPTLIFQRAPSRTTSIDTLRTIQSRSLHSSTPSETRNSLPSGWWFKHKQDIEPLLDDRDKDDAEGTAEDNLRKRCPDLFPRHFLGHTLMFPPQIPRRRRHAF
jgi:hypothetical protein